jgi:TonB family protein
MPGSPSNRGSRAWGAVLVLLLHLAFVWLLTRTPIGESPRAMSAEPVPITVVDLPALRNVDLGPAPLIKVSLDVPRVQITAPAVQDIPTEEPELPITLVPTLPPPSAPTPESASAGINGESEGSADQPGGGKGRLLLTRVPPQYPLNARRLGQEGTTRALLRVDEAGRVVEVKVIASSGSRRLDDAAVSAFSQWKFASVPTGAAPEGSWIQTSHRFLLTQIQYSRLQDTAAEDIRVTETSAQNTAPSGSGQALRRFLEAVAEGGLNDISDRGRAQLAQMRKALSRWGVVKSVELISTAGPAEWTAYQVTEDAGVNAGVSRVDCKWAVLEVRHENAKTAWLIALDRNGTVWSARAGPAP